jgi:aryl-alcohol dehydrogenase-like predicted oxidoreductase
MSAFFGPTDRDESLKALHRAVELGVNFFDTSISYGNFDGENEQLIREGLIEAGFRDQIFIGTKFGYSTSDKPIDASPENVRRSCEVSLKSLGTEVIDLYYLHGKDAEVPIEDTFGAMADLVTAGKVRYLGISNHRQDDIRAAHSIYPLSACQFEYSIFRRDVEESILATCRDLGISFVAYSPLGRGFLTGKLTRFEQLSDDDWRKTTLSQWVYDDFDERVDRIVATLTDIAAGKNATLAQVALAWVHAQGSDILTIAGTKRRRYLEENVGASDIQLSEDELTRLSNLPTWMDKEKMRR